MTNKADLFELSYEVANFRGGIGSVLASKAKQIMDKFKERYICLGALKDNLDPVCVV
jgi:hypothetical protein